MIEPELCKLKQIPLKIDDLFNKLASYFFNVICCKTFIDWHKSYAVYSHDFINVICSKTFIDRLVLT